jgi:hypothetical protein
MAYPSIFIFLSLNVDALPGMCSGVCLSFNRGIWGSLPLLVGEDGLGLAF